MSYNKKIELLESRIRELNENKIKVDVAFGESANALKKITELTEKTELVEGMKISLPFMKTAFEKILELFRVNSDIIREISPAANGVLEEEILKLDKKIKVALIGIESLIQGKKPDTSTSMLLSDIMKELHIIARLLDISRVCIKSTLDKIKN